MNYEWTRMEEAILKQYFNRVPFDEVCGMLPNRSAGAVATRAQALKLHKPNTIRPQEQMNYEMKNATSLEELKAQVAIKEAELGVESADQALSIFDEQMVSTFIGDRGQIDAFVKINSGMRSKMVAALSRARLKLAIARMQQKTYLASTS